MADLKKKYTKEGYQKLIDELDYLKNIRREEIKEALKEARSYGDLSENSEYDEARTQQGMNEARIAELEELVKNAVIMTDDEMSKGKVSIGSTVVIKYKDGKEKKYDIVGSNEVDPLAGKISDLSPIGSALIGKEVNDVVYIYTPAGEKEVVVVSVERTKK
ncbi:MAG: transcription elongation factor GreA [Clostridia bacterium]|nr:transcription elongation factor GreA [Clostridia bacterium]